MESSRPRRIAGSHKRRARRRPLTLRSFRSAIPKIRNDFRETGRESNRHSLRFREKKRGLPATKWSRVDRDVLPVLTKEKGAPRSSESTRPPSRSRAANRRNKSAVRGQPDVSPLPRDSLRQIYVHLIRPGCHF
ncbi:hypothetical protein EVAR_3975_1 [Eumeta japonica]|uniref:Uncharacterized protein n=1 Tax=Eumeta variegata TaxID=151549 RepID=A0A4C1SRN4_EUMVA|nr:hypothetical protein EVAR_3975_1 [Eumeta japonica]